MNAAQGTRVTHASPPARRRGVLLLVLAVVVVAVAVVVVALANRGGGGSTGAAVPTPSSTAARQVASFSGDSDTTTKAFTAALNWELRWTADKGSRFSVELLKPDGTSRGVLVRAGTRTAGSTFVGEAGSFKLKVTAAGPWTVQVRSRPTG